MSASATALPAEPWTGADEATWRDWESGIPEALLPTMANTAPSGIFALEADLATADPAALADADLVDAVVGLEKIAAWARARQYALLAEFHRRPGDGSIRPPVPAPDAREWAADEVALALHLAPVSAGARLGDADRLDGALRPTRDLLAAGRIDDSRARLICTMLATLDDPTATAVQDRVLPAAPEQTWGQLRAALRRAILAVDADGAAERHRRAARQRRVDLFPGDDGMATLWACLPAADAASSYAWITRLARGLQPTGCTDDAGDGPETRSMDARRADVLVALLTGRHRLAPRRPHQRGQPRRTLHPPPRPQGTTRLAGPPAPRPHHGMDHPHRAPLPQPPGRPPRHRPSGQRPTPQHASGWCRTALHATR